MTNTELDALEVRLTNWGSCEWNSVIQLRQDAKDAITTLRAQLAEAQAERDKAWKVAHAATDRGMKAEARADRAEAALAAQIEADAMACSAWGVLSPADMDDGVKWQFDLPDQIAASLRNQPHDRTALDRMLAEARAQALRDAADKIARGGLHTIEDRVAAILALITKEPQT